VKDGVSERGGLPVERKKMTMMMRITPTPNVCCRDWTPSTGPNAEENATHWIGKSLGAELNFKW